MAEPAAPQTEWFTRTTWYWALIGAGYGILLRVLFGMMPASLHGPMSLAFLVGTPLAVGALTVYGLRKRNLTVRYLVFAPWVSVLLMMAGCALALLEGLICIALMLPLFLAFASVGGLLAGFILRTIATHQSSLKAVALLPFLVILGESQLPVQEKTLEISRSVEVDAAPSTIWREILTARSIRADELPFSITHLIGVPRPVEGVNVLTPEGEVRYSKWERGVNFRALVTERSEAESIRWQYVFDSHSFPAGSMDEHVAIGGRYFDLLDTTFRLHPLPAGRSRLELVAHYRVTTTINLYAVPAANLLGRDFVDTILALYKGRGERAERETREARAGNQDGFQESQ